MSIGSNKNPAKINFTMKMIWLFGSFDTSQPPSLDEGRSLSEVETTAELSISLTTGSGA